MSRGRGLSPSPYDRMGVFKRLEDVPDRHRLYHYESAYEGRDVYEEFLENDLYQEHPDATDKFYEAAENAGRRWKAHMDERGRHHALAQPEDVVTWVERLLDRVKVGTAYSQYWVRLEGFYTYLQGQTEHPHAYHPVLMAVPESEAALAVWNYKLSKGNRRGGGWSP